LKDLAPSAASAVLDLFNAHYNETFDSEWKWLDESSSLTYDHLSTASNIMLMGISLASIDKGKKVNTPYMQRAETVKTALSDSVSLKDRLEERQHEILELKKQLQIRGSELQDALWKEQTLEKKIDKLQKAVCYLYSTILTIISGREAQRPYC
jgi:hypothetical protein